MEPVGILVYDIPTAQKTLYHALYHRIRRAGIRVNNSVFLIRWGQKAEIEDIVKKSEERALEVYEMQKKKGIRAECPDLKRANVRVLKFDSISEEEANQMANQAMASFISGIAESLRRRVEKMKQRKEKELPAHAQRALAEKVEIAEGLITVFQLTSDVEHRLQAVKKLVAAQLGAEAVKRFLKGEKKEVA